MTLYEQFQAMDKIPLFEINLGDVLYAEDDWEIYEIYADEKGIWTVGAYIGWDDFFTLDQHLESLYELTIEDIIKSNQGDYYEN